MEILGIQVKEIEIPLLAISHEGKYYLIYNDNIHVFENIEQIRDFLRRILGLEGLTLEIFKLPLQPS